MKTFGNQFDNKNGRHIHKVEKGTFVLQNCKGTKGKTGGYDAILIPGARAKSPSAVKVGAECQAGGSKGLVTAAAGMTAATVCCK